MHPYRQYNNWNYGYTLAPATEQSRGAYTTYGDTDTTEEAADSKAWFQESNGGAQSSAPKSQAFVTSSNRTLSEEISTSKFIGPQVPGHVSPSTQADPQKALVKLHELAIANRLVERYEKVDEPGPGSKFPEFKVKLFIGTETYEGSGSNIKAAKQSAALQALVNTKYRTSKEQKLSMFATARRIGVTATSELHELAAKKGVAVEFKFLEPYNFEFKHSMRMWSKKEMLGSYRVQLNVGGYEFYGNAELPQQAKHNAATQALPIVRSLPEPSSQGHVIATPAPKGDNVASNEVSAVSTGDINDVNVTMALNQIAMINSCVPEWTLISESGPPHQKLFTMQLQIGEYTTVGTGNSKKIAKQGAAEQMMATLPEEWKQMHKRSKKRPGNYRYNFPSKKKVSGPSADGKIAIAADNPISCLHEYTKKVKIPDPEFECVSENVLDSWQGQGGKNFKKTEYTMKLMIEGKTYLASSNTKKAAKLACATEAWNQIRPTIV